MKRAVQIILLLTVLFLLICLAFAMLYGGGLPGMLVNLLILLILAALAVSLVSGIALIYRLLTNGIHAIYNRLLPDNAKPLRPVKRHILIFVVSLAALFALYHGSIAIRSLKPDDPAQYGSFTSKTTTSSDSRYTARQKVVRPLGYEVEMVRVDVYDNNTGEMADSFITDRAFDFWGICWEEGSYNIWIQSGDIGVYCFEEIDGKWIKNFDMERPEGIISRYDWKQTELTTWTYPIPE